MFLPIRSNCDLYYWPFATVGLVVANIAAGFYLDFGTNTHTHDWILAFGDGLHPFQWVTHNFVHFGVMHLVGNMIFLWAFGIGIEGRIGWWRFLTLYLTIGTVGGMVGQLFLADYEGPCPGAGGASLAVFGLLAVAVLWHPFSEVDCLWICCIWGRPIAIEEIEISILWFAGGHILKEFFFANWLYQEMDVGTTSQMFHSLGAVVGAGCGLTMLKLSLVDCEEQDIFHVTRDSRYFDQFKGKSIPPAEVDAMEFDQDELLLDLDEAVVNKNWPESERILNQLSAESKAALDTETLKVLGDVLFQAGRYDAAEAAFSILHTRMPGAIPSVSLKLAAILAEVEKRPKAALRVLDKLKTERLTSRQKKKSAAIRMRADNLISEGHLELLRSS